MKVKSDLETKKNRLFVLTEENVKLKLFITENNNTIKEWLNKNFSKFNPQCGGDFIPVYSSRAIC